MEENTSNSIPISLIQIKSVTVGWGRSLAWLEKIKNEFNDSCEVDLNLIKDTTKLHLWRLSNIARHIKKALAGISVQYIRAFLKSMKEPYKENTCAGFIKTLRDFLLYTMTASSFAIMFMFKI